MTTKLYNKPELKAYCKTNSDRIILVIHGSIYDVTKFADEHPGGEALLREFQIKHNNDADATESFEEVGHSNDAREILTKYLIGKLE